MVVPSLPALLPSSPTEAFGNVRPIFGAFLSNNVSEEIVFFTIPYSFLGLNCTFFLKEFLIQLLASHLFDSLFSWRKLRMFVRRCEGLAGCSGVVFPHFFELNL
jgi:hypothetical protein